MSEEIKAKVVEDENPSTAEKETKALKKMGLDTGAETITKVDLRQPKQEENATEEQSTDEVPVRDGSETSEEVRQENETQSEKPAGESKKEEEKEETIIEEVVESEETEKEAVKNNSVQTPVKTEEPQINIPEGIAELVNFMNETGGSMEDYIKLNKDYDKLDNDNLLKEYYTITKPHLNTEEINFLIQDNFSYDDEIDDAKDVKRKQLAFKEELAKAKTHLHDQKSKYYKEVKPSSNLNKEQQKAIDFFNRYNNEQQAVAQVKEKATNTFNQKTNEVFNEEFKGFDFNIDNRKFKFKLKDVDKVKNTQMDIMNVVGSYLDEDKVTLSDGYGYHKALFAAQNADSIANHFYQLGKTEAVKEISAESKNINMDPRQAGTGYVESGGIKVRAISGDDSSKLRIKLKK